MPRERRKLMTEMKQMTQKAPLPGLFMPGGNGQGGGGTPPPSRKPGRDPRDEIAAFEEAHNALSRVREARHRADWLRERLHNMERRFLPLQNTGAVKVDHSPSGSVTEELAGLRLELEEKLSAAEEEYARVYSDCCEKILTVENENAREALGLVYLEGMRAQDAADSMEVSLSALNGFKREGLKEIGRIFYLQSRGPVS